MAASFLEVAAALLWRTQHQGCDKLKWSGLHQNALIPDVALDAAVVGVGPISDIRYVRSWSFRQVFDQRAKNTIRRARAATIPPAI